MNTPYRHTLAAQPAVLFVALCLLLLAAGASAQSGNGRIVGGQEAVPGAWPFQVAIVQRGADPFNGQFCGGSLIARDWVLTAAHCVQSLTPDDVDIIAGIHNLVTPDPGFRRVAIAEIIFYPGWDPFFADGDAALLRLAEPVDERPAAADALPIGFVALAPADSPSFVGLSSIVTGWGNTLGQPDPGGINYPAGLHQVEVPIISNEYCNAVYGGITDAMLCAGLLRGGADSCQGDSGGPLTVVDPAGGERLLAGIVSFGQGCAVPGIPGVYTRVSAVAEWVREVTVPFAPTDWVYVPATLDVLPVQELLNGDFEQGAGVGWAESSSQGWPLVVAAQNLPPIVQPHNGEWAAWLGGDDSELSILSQEVTVPFDAPYLHYYYVIDSTDACGFDTAVVAVGGTAVDGHDLCFDTITSGWTLRAVDLTAFAGETVLLEFIVSTDSSLYSSLFIDDVAFKESGAE